MFLTGSKIQSEIENGVINITPYNKNNINPHSYNLTLSDEFVVYDQDIIDMKKQNKIRSFKIDKNGYVIKPGELYLARTAEHVKTNKYASVIDGRSSAGRLGIFTHITAGYIDVGFSGFLTLEIVVPKPVKIYPFTKICQISYISLDGDITLYRSNKYQNNAGVQSSMLWKELKDDS